MPKLHTLNDSSPWEFPGERTHGVRRDDEGLEITFRYGLEEDRHVPERVLKRRARRISSTMIVLAGYDKLPDHIDLSIATEYSQWLERDDLIAHLHALQTEGSREVQNPDWDHWGSWSLNPAAIIEGRLARDKAAGALDSEGFSGRQATTLEMAYRFAPNIQIDQQILLERPANQVASIAFLSQMAVLTATYLRQDRINLGLSS